MARAGLSLATGAGSFDAEARAASQGYMAACNRRRVLQIRSPEEFPTFLGSLCGQWSTLTPRTDFSHNLMDGAKAGPQRGRRLASP